MRRIRAFLMRVFGVVPRLKQEQDFSEEIASHLQLHVDDNVRAGMTPEEARREALVKLGGVERTKQAHREGRTLPFVETFVQDLHYALRQLRRSPGFTVTAVLMLALGIGASVAIFAFVDAALIKPPPYADPNRLVDVAEHGALFRRSNLSYLDYLDWKRLNKVFESLDAYSGFSYLLSTPAGAEPVQATRVSDGFFRTLGVRPVLGRDFYSGEDQPNAPATVILSYSTWQTRFGGRKEIVGETVTLSGEPTTVIGVLLRRLMRQFITEGVVLVAIGTVLGVGVGYGAMQVLLRMISGNILANMPYLLSLRFNLHVVVFAVCLSVLAAVIFSVTPALRLPLGSLRGALNDGGRLALICGLTQGQITHSCWEVSVSSHRGAARRFLRERLCHRLVCN